jgi:hypothetical protein
MRLTKLRAVLPEHGRAEQGAMQDSVTLLLAARDRLAEHNDIAQDVIASLCEQFGITEADADAALTAAQVLATAPPVTHERITQVPRPEPPGMAEVVVRRACPICRHADALVTIGRDHDSRGQLRREWVIEVNCPSATCPSALR